MQDAREWSAPTSSRHQDASSICRRRAPPVRVAARAPTRALGQAKLVCEVRFLTWTTDGLLRQVTGLGRPDAVSVYFLDVAAAHSFVDRFACGMAVTANPRPEDRPR
jgi:hypothetical protein